MIFGSDGGIMGPGFWVDEIAFDTGEMIVAVEDGDVAPPLRATLAAFPNLFNPVTTIAWRLPAPGRLSVDVFYLRGASCERYGRVRSRPRPEV